VFLRDQQVSTGLALRTWQNLHRILATSNSQIQSGHVGGTALTLVQGAFLKTLIETSVARQTVIPDASKLWRGAQLGHGSYPADDLSGEEQPAPFDIERPQKCGAFLYTTLKCSRLPDSFLVLGNARRVGGRGSGLFSGMLISLVIELRRHTTHPSPTKG
jgi:hypothetical protein